MNREEMKCLYFDYLINLVCTDSQKDKYSDMLNALYTREFYAVIEKDNNRISDGINLRPKFAEDNGISFFEQRRLLNEPCSVLEMMVALAVRCEDSIMGNEKYGDRTGKWFWVMIRNLELFKMINKHYDDEYTHFIISQMIDRQYDRNGKGGLFCVPDRKDMKKAEIWYQMCWYLNTIGD